MSRHAKNKRANQSDLEGVRCRRTLRFEGLEGRLLMAGSVSDLPVGEVVAASISRAGEKDQFEFQGKKGQIVQLVVTRTSGNANFKPYVKVFSPSDSRQPIQEFWFGKDAQFKLPQQGKYVVQVQDDNLKETGKYKVGLEKVNPPSPKSIALVEGGIVQKRIGQSLQKDQFVFQGKKGEIVQLAVTPISGDGNFKPYIKVYAPGHTGAPMAEFWFGRDTQLTLPRDGTYLVQVQDDNLFDLGDYKVGLEKVSTPSPNPTALQVGGIVAGNISQSLQKDQFVFQGKKGEIIQLVVTPTSGNGNFKPFIKVYAPGHTGAPMAEFWFGRDTQLALPQDGTYLVQVQDDNLFDLGDYKVGLEKVSTPSPNPTALQVGGIVAGRISQSLQKDQFVFQGKKGEIVQLVVTPTSGNGNFKPFIKVYAPGHTGAPMAEFWFGRDTQLALPQDGTYLVQVQDDNLFDLGDYKVGLEKVNPPSPNPITLRAGQTIERRIGESLQKDQFVLQGRAGQTVELLVTRKSGSANFKPYVKVYAPSNLGTPIQEFWLNTTTRFTLPSNGTYLVQVQDDNLFDLGDYAITFRA